MPQESFHPDLIALRDQMAATPQALDPEILPLLDAFFHLPGLVTTLSCAGHDRGGPLVHFGISDPVAGLRSLQILVQAGAFFDWHVLGVNRGRHREMAAAFLFAPAEGYRESVGSLHPSVVTAFNSEAARQAMETIADLARHMKTLSVKG